MSRRVNRNELSLDAPFAQVSGPESKLGQSLHVHLLQVVQNWVAEGHMGSWLH